MSEGVELLKTSILGLVSTYRCQNRPDTKGFGNKEYCGKPEFWQYGIRDKDVKNLIWAFVRNTGSRNRCIRGTDRGKLSDFGGGLTRSSNETFVTKAELRG